ncbi:hypothetical protein Hte_000757 [Hypoxylon texense]
MAQPSATAKNWLFELPLDIVYDWFVHLYTNDPAVLLHFAVAVPELFFNDNLNIATLDARHQALPDSGIAPSPQALSNLAIHLEDSPPWFIRRFLDALAEVHPDAINGIFPSGRGVEPPLHAAVRAGRADIVDLLITRYQQFLQLDTVYQRLQGPNRCQLASKPHHPPCQHTQATFINCSQASAYATNFYALEHKLRVRKGIQDTAVRLVVASQFPHAWCSPDYVTDLLISAAQQGMFLYCQAIIHQIMTRPDLNPMRDNLLANPGLNGNPGVGGLAALLRMAILHADSTVFMGYLFMQANAHNVSLFQDRFLLISFPNGLYPPTARSHMANAFLILRQLMYEAEKSAAGVEQLATALMISLGHTKPATSDVVHDYFLLQCKAADQVLDKRLELTVQSRVFMESYFDRAASASFGSGPNGFKNACHLVHERGHASSHWLQKAITCKNGPILKEILTYWKTDPASLHGGLDFPGLAVSPLHRCIQTQFPSGVIHLLDAGVDPYTVHKDDWMVMALQLSASLDQYYRGESNLTLEAMVNRYYYGQWRPSSYSDFEHFSPLVLQEIDDTIWREFCFVIEVAQQL